MKPSQLFSRRSNEPRKVNFSPTDPQDKKSPYHQVARLASLLDLTLLPPDDLEDMDEILDAYHEYLFRKIFPGTTHDEYIATPVATRDWLLAVAEVDQEHYRNIQSKRKENRAQ